MSDGFARRALAAVLSLKIIVESALDGFVNFRLPCHPDEGEHHCNDCFLVYHRFAYIVIPFIIYTTFIAEYLFHSMRMNHYLVQS